jgi:glycerophosphoryl diester phosphodiesterase
MAWFWGGRMKGRFVAILGAGVLFVPVYLSNASWLASPSTGRPTLIAQRGIHQLFEGSSDDPHDCRASHILPPQHRFIENTLPSIEAAIGAGADVVEVDVRETADGEFILFHEAGLKCRTEGEGAINRISFNQMKRLDVGYNYTADGGKTFPLRGVGRGLMTTLDEALRAFPRQRFLVQLKDGPAAGANLVLYINNRHPASWKRISLFGDTLATAAAKKLRPDIPVIHDRRAAKCTAAYVGLGWAGYVPEPCREGTIIVAMNARNLAWGWPSRFLNRMMKSKTEVMAIGSVSGFGSNSFTRLDGTEELSKLPTGFDGLIWTDRVEIIGPAVRQQWPS